MGAASSLGLTLPGPPSGLQHRAGVCPSVDSCLSNLTISRLFDTGESKSTGLDRVLQCVIKVKSGVGEKSHRVSVVGESMEAEYRRK